MRLRFNVNFEFKTDRPRKPHQHGSDVGSDTERRPSHDAGVDDAGVLPDENRVAPMSRPVLGFVARTQEDTT